MKIIDTFVQRAEAEGLYILQAKVVKHGDTIGEWTRFIAKPRFEAYSIAKTFSAIAVGMALEDGIIHINERVSDTFRNESFDINNKNALNITVKDLLTMTAGLSETMMWRDGYERKHVNDWIRYFYTNGKFENKPGTTFLYNNACTYLLGALIQKKIGMNIGEYLRYRLFEAIGIHNVEWGICPMGRTIAANGLSLNVDELSNFGQFLLNGGIYNGKRLLNKEFIDEMMTANMVTDEIIPADSYVQANYGYQIWLDPLNDAAFMWGIFGQYCVVLPKKQAVISVLSLDTKDGGSNGIYETSAVRKLIWEELVSQV